MVTIGSNEVRTNLSSVLERVQRGEGFVITRRGVPVAEILPIRVTRRSPEDLKDLAERLNAFGKGRSLGMPIKEAIEEGRSLGGEPAFQFGETETTNLDEMTKRIQEERKGRTLGMSIREAIETGRRF